jgi:hypothetical protein
LFSRKWSGSWVIFFFFKVVLEFELRASCC